jgi:hypothetical protein
MSTLKTTNLQHASAASPSIVLASDGSATAQLSSLNGGPLAGLRNRVINGRFDIWQRGTSSTSLGYQTADRFRYADNGSSITITQSQQSFTLGQTDVPGEPAYFYRVAKTVAGTSGNFTAIEHGIEDVRTLAGQTATISFYAKCGSGTASSTVYLAQYFGSGGSANVNTSTVTCTLTTSWQKFTATVSVPSISGKTVGAGHCVFLTIQLPNNAVQTVDLALVQVEAGSVATPFERRSYGQELALCQRYLPAFISTGSNNALCPAYSYNTTGVSAQVQFPVTARVSPTGISISSASHFTFQAVNSFVPSAVTFDNTTASNANITLTVSGATAGQGGRVIFNNASGQLLFTGCEL